MTQVVTVSASTAAYAAEPLKASARVSGSSPVQETMHALTQEARKTDGLRHHERMNVVGPPALALFFLTAGQQSKQMQQVTLQQAEDAYFDGNHEQEAEALDEDGANEQAGNEQDAEEQSTDEQSADEQSTAEENTGEEFFEFQSEILALPAPETSP